MQIKSLNEVYKLSDTELFNYAHTLNAHNTLVLEEVRRRNEKSGKGLKAKHLIAL